MAAKFKIFKNVLPLGRPLGLELVVDGEDLETDPWWYKSKLELIEVLEDMIGATSSIRSPAASQPNMAVVLKASSKARLTALSLIEPRFCWPGLLEFMGLFFITRLVLLLKMALLDVVGDDWSKEFSLEEFGALLVFFLWKNFRLRSAFTLEFLRLWGRPEVGEPFCKFKSKFIIN